MVGFLLWCAVLPEAEILSLAVTPASRRQGVAASLLAGFEAQVATAGCTTVFLEVDVTNLAAVQLYHSHGYVDAGVRQGYYKAADGCRTDAQVMRKTVAVGS